MAAPPGGVPTGLRVGGPSAPRLSRRAKLCHGAGRAFGASLLRCRRERNAQGQTPLNRVPQHAQQMRALSIWARGARGAEPSCAREGMRRIVNGHDVQGVIA